MDLQIYGRLVYFNESTLNTPYAFWLTESKEGVAIVSGEYNYYQIVFAVLRGNTNIFIHSTNNGISTGWYKISGTKL